LLRPLLLVALPPASPVPGLPGRRPRRRAGRRGRGLRRLPGRRRPPLPGRAGPRRPGHRRPPLQPLPEDPHAHPPPTPGEGLPALGAASALRLDAPAAEDKKGEKPADKAGADKKGETLHYTGKVTDKLTGKPIAGATVTVRRSLLGDPRNTDYNKILQETKHK